MKEGGSFDETQLFAMVAAVALSIVTYGYGAASAAIGGMLEGSTFAAAVGTTTTAGLGNIALSAGIAAVVGSAASQEITTGLVNWGSALEAGAIAAVTAGLTNGITYTSGSGLDFQTGPLTVGGPTSSLAGLAGVQAVGNSLVPTAGTSTASSLAEEALAMGADATIAAGVQTAIEGGSFGTVLRSGLVSDAAAAGAYAIGNEAMPLVRRFRRVHRGIG